MAASVDTGDTETPRTVDGDESVLDLAVPLIERRTPRIPGPLAGGLAAPGIAQADPRPSPALESCSILEHVPRPNRMTILPGDTEAARLAVLRLLERSPDLSQRDRA